MQGANQSVVIMEEDLKGLDMASVCGASRKDDNIGLIGRRMVGLPILTEKGEDEMIISELVVRRPGGHVKQNGFDIKLHQERGQDRDGAVAYI